MWKEFKEFAMKGNVLDLAVGVIIGAAFSKIVTSLVEDIVMPPLSIITQNIDFANLFIQLGGTKAYSTMAEAKKAGIPVIAYGQFLTNVLNFVIVAFAVFIFVKQINRVRKGDEPAPTTHECPFCISTVSLKATRCPNCTSPLEPAPVPAVETASALSTPGA